MPHRFPVPLDTLVMEARLADELPGEIGVWQFEPKWDGFRCLVFKSGKKVELLGKSGKPLARYFPELVGVFQKHPDDFVVDGEILIATDAGLSFEALQMRLHPAPSRILKLSSATPAHVTLFDALFLSKPGNLMARPLTERRSALERFVAAVKSPSLTLSPFTTDAVEAKRWLDMPVHQGTDGVVAKARDEPYRPGDRAMLKIKRLRTADCVVGGFRYLANSRLVGSLLLGLYDDEGKLHHVGFTSTIANSERAELTARLEKLKGPPGFTGKAPGGPSRWTTDRSAEWEPLKPILVAEVRFDHVTGNRFRHGTKFLRWRPDKSPGQCGFDQIA